MSLVCKKEEKKLNPRKITSPEKSNDLPQSGYVTSWLSPFVSNNFGMEWTRDIVSWMIIIMNHRGFVLQRCHGLGIFDVIKTKGEPQSSSLKLTCSLSYSST